MKKEDVVKKMDKKKGFLSSISKFEKIFWATILLLWLFI